MTRAEELLKYYIKVDTENNWFKSQRILIDTRTRSELLLLTQGKITNNGRVHNIDFKNLKGGIWEIIFPSNLGVE